MHKKFEILSHTADLRIRVFGENINELFQNAAFALAAILHPEVVHEVRRSTVKATITVSGQDQNVLLVDFLNAILAKSQIEKAVYPTVVFRAFGGNVEAEISGHRVHRFEEDVKAVTHHEAEIKENRNRILETNLVMDV
ncbi:MAG: archease [Parcubacteria group bacterium]|nr:archease [Parcubacteria group bacterium]